ncbi:PTS sugar transporter subunit IIC [Vagococcus elongatus]|uniref:Permease IIC component n=1 Tax=Vagococcus elongatus TaxID=180344 RepID=A0A430B4B8_9ENTE|nr:PTS transporter subunit EIIC [Vagococcus elongatus]RSU15153.1 PTS sugar transporter subunit IIBC [Vagococcus elongatus]
MNSGLLEKLDSILSPIGNKFGNQRHLKAISSGMMFGLPFIVVGSLFLIIANPPINMELYHPQTANVLMRFLASWKEFAIANYDIITLPYEMTMGIFSLIAAFGIGSSLAGIYQMNKETNGFIAVVVFMMTSVTLVDGHINKEYLGTNGLFMAIILSLLVVEVSRLFENPKFQIKMPDTVPPAITSFVNSLLPLIVNIIIFYGLSIIIFSATGKIVPALLMDVLTPAVSIANSLWGYIAIITFANVLWLLGINGPSIIFPIVFTLGITNTGLNTELVEAGKQAIHPMNLQMFRIAVMGGAGGTLGLLVLMLRSKKEQIKALGKLSAIPAICGINEPMIFGVPLVFNPVLAIPFLISPIVNLLLTYYAQVLGIISMGYLVDPSFTPFFAQAYLSSLDWRNVVFTFVLVALNTVIYYPFFKVYEKNA